MCFSNKLAVFLPFCTGLKALVRQVLLYEVKKEAAYRMTFSFLDCFRLLRFRRSQWLGGALHLFS
jgi:hypothetical protein